MEHLPRTWRGEKIWKGCCYRLQGLELQHLGFAEHLHVLR